jgi:hypothetical protein
VLTTFKKSSLNPRQTIRLVFNFESNQLERTEIAQGPFNGCISHAQAFHATEAGTAVTQHNKLHSLQINRQHLQNVCTIWMSANASLMHNRAAHLQHHCTRRAHCCNITQQNFWQSTQKQLATQCFQSHTSLPQMQLAFQPYPALFRTPDQLPGLR